MEMHGGSIIAHGASAHRINGLSRRQYSETDRQTDKDKDRDRDRHTERQGSHNL